MVFIKVALFTSALCASFVRAALTPGDGSPQDYELAPQGTRILPRLEKQRVIDNGQQKEIRYGPFTIPPRGRFMKNEVATEATKPCKNCYVTAMQSTIKHLNGTEALPGEGAFLHHTVFRGGKQGTMWGASNERPVLRLNSQKPFGLDWPNDFFINIELMNEAIKPLDVYVAITFEYVLKSQPGAARYRPAYLRWNDVGYPKAKEGTYSFNSSTWTSPISGELLYAIGHMHDGGTDTRLYINGKIVCMSIMHYGGRSGYGGENFVEASDPTAHSAPSRARRDEPGTKNQLHISDQGMCSNFGRVEKGDKMRIEALYDTTKHSLLMHNGSPEALMGNMRVYIGLDAGQSERLTQRQWRSGTTTTDDDFTGVHMPDMWKMWTGVDVGKSQGQWKQGKGRGDGRKTGASYIT